jgi:hypothetical protein
MEPGNNQVFSCLFHPLIVSFLLDRFKKYIGDINFR